MSTLHYDVFDIADAYEWLSSLRVATDDTLVEEALDALIFSSSTSVDPAEAACALLAMEIVAAALGEPGDAVIEHTWIQEWITRTRLRPTEARTERALLALERLLNEGTSLPEAWELDSDLESWSDYLNDLKQRLEA